MGSRESLRLYLVKRFRSGPPFLYMAAATMFVCRAIAGPLFSYGSPTVSVFSLILFVMYLAACSRRFFPGPIRKAEADLSRNIRIVPRRILFILPAVPFVLVSILALIDFQADRSGAIFAWPVILIAAAFFISIAESFAVAAIVAIACGVGVSLGLFADAPNFKMLFILGSSLLIALLVYILNLSEGTRAFNETAERVEREHTISTMRDAEVEIAARIQRALLLDVPSSQCLGLRLEAITVASNAVDGDFYGFFPYSSDSVDVLVGDVMGKGVPAALLGAALKSSFLRSSLKLLVDEPGVLPRLTELVTSVHEIAAEELSNLESFATLQYARVDSKRSRLDFVDCGHTPILHFDSTLNVVWSIKGSDLPLGFSETHSYTCYTIPLSEKDRLLFYSDGITEAPNGNGELFGDVRLSSIVKANASLEPGELVRRILNTAMYFTSSSGFRDDVTCIAFSVDHSEAIPKRKGTVFRTDTSSLGAIRSFIEAELVGVESDTLGRIQLAVSEAASNVLRHGLTKESAEEVEESLEPILDEDEEESADTAVSLDADSIRVEVVDTVDWKSVRLIYHGTPFAWYVPPTAPDIETLPEGGFGRTLMAKAAESVLYATGPDDLQLVCLFFEIAP